MKEKWTDEELIARHVAGETGAFEAIVVRYRRPIYNLSYRMAGNASDAADLTQDIFLQLLRKAALFRKESSFKTWFYRMATNCCYDFLRRNRGREVSADPIEEYNAGAEADPADSLENREVGIEVHKAISELPLDQRSLVVLRDIYGYEYSEIARITGLRLGTVKSKLNRARLALCERLTPLREQMRAPAHLNDGGRDR